MPKLPLSYYQHHDVLFLSKDLLGKFLFTKIGAKLTGGMIIETEAYRAPEDRASHAYGNKRTKRNAPMYMHGGVCYVYQCYGIHYLLNIITNLEEIPHGILIRAIFPIVGIDEMLKRRGKNKIDKSFITGPGTVTEALGITLEQNCLLLNSAQIWIEDKKIKIPDEAIIVGPRIGVEYAKEDALLPWRFRVSPTWLKAWANAVC